MQGGPPTKEAWQTLKSRNLNPYSTQVSSKKINLSIPKQGGGC